jgi:hypothetical protein
MTETLGVGLDIGTMNLVSARKNEDETVSTARMRDAFLDLPPEAKKMLKLSGVNYIERGDTILIVGDPAIDTANIFNREARRPLAQGIISPSESDSFEVLALIIEQLLGEPQEENEVCFYSVPAAPIDKPGTNITYHRKIFERIIRELGYKPMIGFDPSNPSQESWGNEALAIIYSECAKDRFSGIGISFGSGMVNIAMAYQTIMAMSFSLARGGDWIDQNAGNAVGATASRMCSVKEKGVNLMAPEDRQQEAIAFYYEALIDYALNSIVKEFARVQDTTTLPNAIPIIVSGGTSLADGFLDLFKKVFEEKRKSFPIEVSEIRAAGDPMTSVAQGLLVQALQEYL